MRSGKTANVRFRDFVRLLGAFGFQRSRVRGSHQWFFHEKDRVGVSIQSLGSDAKPYQLRELLRLIDRYNWTLDT